MAYRDSKVVVDLKDIEHGEILYTDTDGKTHTYYPTRNIWLEVQTLEVLTILGDPKEEGAEPPLLNRVRGAAMLEDRSISVVGDPESKVRTLTISFEAGDWRPKPEEPKPELFPSMHTYLGGAMLGFNRADWEIGNSDDWWIVCYLPKLFIEALVTDIRSGQLYGMKLSLVLRDLYTTEHRMAPVSSRGHLFIRPNKRDNTIGLPEIATGHVCAIHFASASLDLNKSKVPELDETFATDEEMHPTPLEDSVGTAVAVLGARLEQMHVTVRWVGGFIMAALLLIAFK